VVPLQQPKSKLVDLQYPLIWLVSRAVDVVGSNRYVWVAAGALRSPRVEHERDLPLNALVT